MKITTMLLKASGYIFLVFFQVSSITILFVYMYIYKFTRHVTTSDLPIPEAGDIRARKRF